LKKYLKKGNNIGQNNIRRHYGAQSEQWCVGGIYRLSILISSDVSQLIQKIIGISWLTPVDTINQIFGIGCIMSADTNNVSGITGVLCRRKTLIFPPSTPPPPSTPCRRCHHRQPHLRPRCRTIANPVAVSPSSFPTRRAAPSPTLSHRRHRQPHRVTPSSLPFPRLESCHEVGASPISIG
jgi:hypothetical protein